MLSMVVRLLYLHENKLLSVGWCNDFKFCYKKKKNKTKTTTRQQTMKNIKSQGKYCEHRVKRRIHNIFSIHICRRTERQTFLFVFLFAYIFVVAFFTSIHLNFHFFFLLLQKTNFYGMDLWMFFYRIFG